MHRGYIRLWRKFGDHEFWQERRSFSRAEAWIDIVCFLARGVGNTEMERGEFEGSVRYLAKRWGWNPSAVYRFIRKLDGDGMIQRVKHQPKHLSEHFTVCKYDTYNEPRNTNRNTKRNKLKEGLKEGEKKKAPPDPRHQPLVRFMSEEFQRLTNLKLFFDPSDAGRLSQTLKEAPLETYTLERLKVAWTRFLKSDDPFHKKMRGQKPVRWWSANLNAFMKETQTKRDEFSHIDPDTLQLLN